MEPMVIAIMLMEDSHRHAFKLTLRILVDAQHIVIHSHRAWDLLTVEESIVNCMCPIAPVPQGLITQQDKIPL